MSRSIVVNRLPAVAGLSGYSLALCLASGMTIDASLNTQNPPAVRGYRPISPSQTASRLSRVGAVGDVLAVVCVMRT